MPNLFRLSEQTVNMFFGENVDLILAEYLRKAQPAYCAFFSSIMAAEMSVPSLSSKERDFATTMSEGGFDILSIYIMEAKALHVELPVVSQIVMAEFARSIGTDRKERHDLAVRSKREEPYLDDIIERKTNRALGDCPCQEDRDAYRKQYTGGILVGRGMLSRAFELQPNS